jgi:hypothetical protein
MRSQPLIRTTLGARIRLGMLDDVSTAITSFLSTELVIAKSKVSCARL